MARIIVVFNKKVIKEYPFTKGSLTIGRNDSNDIMIDNLAVSGLHARIDKSGDIYILTDLQSTNGTFVNDKIISSHKLQHKDKITVGKHLLFFAMSQEEQAKIKVADLDRTMILDTAQHKELLEKQAKEKGVEATTVLDVFGARSGRAMGTLVKTGSEAIDTLYDMNKASSGTAKIIAEMKLDNLSGDVTILKSALQGAAISLSKGMNPAMRKAVQMATKVTDGFNKIIRVPVSQKLREQKFEFNALLNVLENAETGYEQSMAII